jgi:hypothetical protein
LREEKKTNILIDGKIEKKPVVNEIKRS